MKKVLSLLLVMIMIFVSCFTMGVIPSVNASSVSDAEGFSSVYFEGFETSAVPNGGKANIWTNNAVLSSDNTDTKNLDLAYYSVTYLKEGLKKPDSSENFGSKLVKMDTVQRGIDIASETEKNGAYIPNGNAIYRFGQIKNQITFQQGKTYRVTMWVYLKDTLAKNSTTTHLKMYMGLYTGGSTSYMTLGTSDTRTLRLGEWHKIGFEFIPTSEFISSVESEGFSVRGDISATVSGDYPTVAYFDNLKVELLGERTRKVEDNYYYEENFTFGNRISTDYYKNYFTPTYPKPSDNQSLEWKTRPKYWTFGSGTPSYSMSNSVYYSDGYSMKNTLATASANGGVKLTDLFHGDFTSEDVGRRFRVSAYVYPDSNSAVTNGGGNPIFQIALGGSDPIGGSGNYGNAYRTLRVSETKKQIPWDTWSEISTIYEVKEEHICQTSVKDADVKTSDTYRAVNEVRISQASESKNLTSLFYTDHYVVDELLKYSIDATSSDTGLGTVSGGGEVWEDEETTLVAKPYRGVAFTGWYKNGTLVSAVPELKISYPYKDASYVAKFTPYEDNGIISADGFEEKYICDAAERESIIFNAFGSIAVNGENIHTNGLNKYSSYSDAIIPPLYSQGAVDEDFGSDFYHVNAYVTGKAEHNSEKNDGEYSDNELTNNVSMRIYGAKNPMKEGKWYRISYWQKFVDSKYSELSMARFKSYLTMGTEGNNTNSTVALSGNYTLKKGVWQKVGFVFKATASEETTKFGIRVDSLPENMGTYIEYPSEWYIDNLKIEEYVGTPETVPVNYIHRDSFDDMNTGVISDTNNTFFYDGNPGGYTLNYTEFSKDNGNNKHDSFDKWGDGVSSIEVVSDPHSVRTGSKSIKVTKAGHNETSKTPKVSAINGGIRITNIFHSPITDSDIGKTFRISAWILAKKDDIYTGTLYDADGNTVTNIGATNPGTSTKIRLGLGGIPPYDDTEKTNQTTNLAYRGFSKYSSYADVNYDEWTQINLFWTVPANEIAGAMNSSGQYTVIDALRIDQYLAEEIGTTIPYMSTFYVDDLMVEEVGTQVSVVVAENNSSQISAKAVVEKSLSDTDNTAVLILASYDKNGMLISVNASDVITFNSLSEKTETQPVTISKEGVTSVYAYVWESLETARPYMSRVNITYSDITDN